MTIKHHGTGEESAEATAGWRLALLALVMVAGTCLLVHGCHQPPTALGVEAPEDCFSAERAYERLVRLLGDQAPHPLGTTANELVP